MSMSMADRGTASSDAARRARGVSKEEIEKSKEGKGRGGASGHGGEATAKKWALVPHRCNGACGRKLLKTAFSDGQWNKKSASARKCWDCITTARYTPPGGRRVHADEIVENEEGEEEEGEEEDGEEEDTCRNMGPSWRNDDDDDDDFVAGPCQKKPKVGLHAHFPIVVD